MRRGSIIETGCAFNGYIEQCGSIKVALVIVSVGLMEFHLTFWEKRKGKRKKKKEKEKRKKKKEKGKGKGKEKTRKDLSIRK